MTARGYRGGGSAAQVGPPPRTPSATIRPHPARTPQDTTPTLKVGFTFTHAHLLDIDWKPRQDQRYKDAPKAVCRVTRFNRYQVWFRTLAGSFHTVARDVFESDHLHRGL